MATNQEGDEISAALLLSSQQVKHHFVAESLITSTVKDALSRDTT